MKILAYLYPTYLVPLSRFLRHPGGIGSQLIVLIRRHMDTI